MSDSSHAYLPPSSASRWSVCTASVKYCEDHKDELPPEGSSFADEGTKAHEIAAAVLKRTVGQVAPSPDMQAHVNDYVAWVSERSKQGTLMVERRVPLFYLPSQHGTTDAAARTPEYIFVGDLKYGAGVSVDAWYNKQLASYAESIIRDQKEIIDDVDDDFPVILGIFQPRDRNNPKPIREWKLTRGELREFCQPIQEAATLILEHPEQTKFVPGDAQCRFCPARYICPARNAHSLEVFEPIVDAVATAAPFSVPTAASVSREKRQAILKLAPGIYSLLEDLEKMEIHELMQGAPVLNYKLVAGKTNRQWSDQEAVDKLLRNYLSVSEFRPPSDVISPAQVEKLLKAHETSTRFNNALEKLIVKPEGKPTLVPVEDKRPALQFDATTSQFDDENVV